MYNFTKTIGNLIVSSSIFISLSASATPLGAIMHNLNIPGHILEENCDVKNTPATCIRVLSTNACDQLQLYPQIIKSVNNGHNIKIDTNILGIKNDDRSLIVCDSTPERCVKVSVDQSSHNPYLAYYSRNGGKTWKISKTEKDNHYGYAHFDDLACGNNIKHCVAVGTMGENIHTPIALRTSNGGKSWQIPTFTIPPFCDQGITEFQSVKCDATGLTCEAQGRCDTFNQGWVTFTTAV